MEKITITISAATLQAIGAGLNELPYKIASPAVLEIDVQVKEYLSKKEGRVSSHEGMNHGIGKDSGGTPAP